MLFRSKYNHLWEDCVEEEAIIMAKSKETREENQALAAHRKGKQKRYFPQKNQGERSNNRNEGRSNNRHDRRFDNKFERGSDKRRQDRRPDPKGIQCFGCEGYGHVKKDCPSVQ